MKDSDLRIEPLADGEIPAAARLVARVMSATPIHVATFQGSGRSIVERQRKMFELVLQYSPGRTRLAKESGTLVGLCRAVRWPRCRLADEEAKKIASLMKKALHESLPRVSEWIGLWTSEDPPVPHWHLGPIVVEEKLQGRGIGSRLLEEFCAEVDAGADAAYLETDREENVRLYERFGFERRGTADLFGVTNYFMWRSPRP